MSDAKQPLSPKYARRLARGLARGLTRAQARGHGQGVGSGQGSRANQAVKSLAAAIRRFRKTGDLNASAKTERVAPERLRRALYGEGLVIRERGRLRRVRREMDVPTRGRIRTLELGASAASRAGEFLNAVRTFRGRPDLLLLAPFEGEGVTDVHDRFHPFETDPSALYEIALMEGASYEQVYRLVTIT